MNFTWDALNGAQTALNKLRNRYLESSDGGVSIPGEFVDAINDDLNFPKALSSMWENIDNLNKPSIERIDEVLGLGLADFHEDKIDVPKEVLELVKKREELRNSGKWEEADKVRDEITEKGFVIDDTPNGPQIRKS